MKIFSKILNMHFIVAMLLCMILPIGRAEQRERERELYQKTFFLNLKIPEAPEDEPGEDGGIAAEEQDENYDYNEDEDEDEEDANKIVMSDDYFVLPPEGKRREDILFFILLPGVFGILTLFLGWTYLKVWLHGKKEAHQICQRLFKLRSEFRGKPTDPEFRSQLKKTLHLPPGASSADINRKMPVQDKELQNMINKYDEKFRKSDS